MRDLTASAAPARSTNPYRVMIVDDSAVIGGLFKRFLEADPDIEIVAAVGDGQRAIDLLKNKKEIEIIVLDIEMPRMDGITALPELLKVDPGVQIVMASTLTARNADISLKALSLGARDYLTKPSSTLEMTRTADFPSDLLSKVKAFGAQRRRKSGASAPAARTARTAPRQAPATARAALKPTTEVQSTQTARSDVHLCGSQAGDGPMLLLLAVLPASRRRYFVFSRILRKPSSNPFW